MALLDVQDRLRTVEGEVAAVRRRVTLDGRALYRSWGERIERHGFAPGALNLAHYLILRQIDLRPLQRELMSLGLSSLGRAEGRVLATLDAVAGAIGRMLARAPGDRRHMPSERQFFRGERLLADAAADILGPPSLKRAGRIMVTLGLDAADDPAVVADLARRGANLVRINCAHDSQDAWTRMIANVRAADPRLRILMDIGGPKLRVEGVSPALLEHRLTIGSEVLLCRALDPAATEFPLQCTSSHPGCLDRIGIGDRVSFDDGALRGAVVRSVPAGLVVRIEDGKLKGIRLRRHKGLIFPTIDLGLEPLSDEDRANLGFIADHADLVGYSFVETAGHVTLLQDELKRHRADWQRLGLVAKIETPRAVRNLPEIIVQAAGRQPLAVMIARGDLAIELGFERLAEMQEEILWLCEAAHVPAIWATQVLEDLVKKGVPSRGEMTDAAMSSRAECVMLNKGPNVGVAVDALDRLLRRMGEHQVKKTPTLRALKSWAASSGSRTDSRPSAASDGSAPPADQSRREEH